MSEYPCLALVAMTTGSFRQSAATTQLTTISLDTAPGHVAPRARDGRVRHVSLLSPRQGGSH